MKKLVFIMCISIITFCNVYSSHFLGGEITWRCQTNGSFKFTLKIYENCNDPPMSNFTGLSTTHPVSAFSLSLVSTQDISPQGLGCFYCGSPGDNPEEFRELVFESGDVFLNGTPPPQGWIFYWSTCCRSDLINNINASSSQSATLRAVMYSNQSTNPCLNSSPFFAEKPELLMCTKNLSNYSHLAYDEDLDSLTYEFDYALGAPFVIGGVWQPEILAYQSPFSYNNPIPQSSQMNINTGEVTFFCNNPGSYLVITKVSSFKCGIKTSEIFREIPLTFIDCIISPGPPVVFNTSPDVNAPFVNPSSGLFEWYSDTVNAGDLVQFSLNAVDFEFNSNNSPQIVTVNASASQFGSGFTDPNSGCLIPPCATLLPPAPTSAVAGVAMYFEWQTDCSHVLYDSLCSILGPETFNFNFSVKDDFCPANGMENAVITIVVNPGPLCNPVSTDDMEIYSGINIFPFSESEIVVEILMKDYTIADLYITDMQGRTLKLMDINGFPGKNSLKIFTKDISPGVYFLQLKTSNSIVNKKFALIK